MLALALKLSPKYLRSNKFDLAPPDQRPRRGGDEDGGRWGARRREEDGGEGPVTVKRERL